MDPRWKIQGYVLCITFIIPSGKQFKVLVFYFLGIQIWTLLRKKESLRGLRKRFPYHWTLFSDFGYCLMFSAHALYASASHTSWAGVHIWWGLPLSRLLTVIWGIVIGSPKVTGKGSQLNWALYDWHFLQHQVLKDIDFSCINRIFVYYIPLERSKDWTLSIWRSIQLGM